MESFSTVVSVLLIAIPVIIAITFHEAAHGFVAWKLGDDTAYRLGRVTFNPLRHIDAFGTIVLPAILIFANARFLFGWAKPVPVNFNKLRNPRRDMVLVAAAGPFINVVLAFVSAVLLHLDALFSQEASQMLKLALGSSILINTMLAVFNMLPLPPLDGGRVAVGLLPDKLAGPLARLERWGMLIVIGLVIVLPLVASEFGYRINIISSIVWPVAVFVFDIIATLTGADVREAVVIAIREFIR